MSNFHNYDLRNNYKFEHETKKTLKELTETVYYLQSQIDLLQYSTISHKNDNTNDCSKYNGEKCYICHCYIKTNVKYWSCSVGKEHSMCMTCYDKCSEQFGIKTGCVRCYLDKKGQDYEVTL